ncbi:MAG: DNA-binding response regulator [Candidatus Thiodiazotropha sp.]|jgi:DNA-binding NarL/FixJ family response regulator
MLDNNNPIVLVVDDSPDSLGMINTALNQAGFTVLVSLNGQQALDIVAQIKPHVVLMDALMPVMDGFECCQRMRQSLPLTPIIFMTGLTEVEHIVKAFEHGGTDYIPKPIKPEELLARINLHLNNANLINNARIALDEARQYVMAVNPAGKLLWATPETQDLLKRHEIDTKTLDPGLQSQIQDWLNQRSDEERVVHTKQKPLTLRYFKQISQEEHLVRIVTQERLMDTEKLEAMLPITKREAEVLLWVAHGKTNKEIGEILSLSPRTVNKHLEQIYPKIRVDNRAAATSVAIQTLLGVPFH